MDGKEKVAVVLTVVSEGTGTGLVSE